MTHEPAATPDEAIDAATRVWERAHGLPDPPRGATRREARGGSRSAATGSSDNSDADAPSRTRSSRPEPNTAGARTATANTLATAATPDTARARAPAPNGDEPDRVHSVTTIPRHHG